jgi:signal transduction histidine kinase
LKIKPVVNHLLEVFNELVESIQIKQDTEIKSDKIELKDSIEKILIGFKTQIVEYDANIKIKVNKAPVVYFPHKYMESILTNLISNSFKYKSPLRKPEILIETRKLQDGIVQMTFSDNGLGIDLVRHKDNIF